VANYDGRNAHFCKQFLKFDATVANSGIPESLNPGTFPAPIELALVWEEWGSIDTSRQSWVRVSAGTSWDRRRSERTLLLVADQSMFATPLDSGLAPYQEKIGSMVVNAHGGLIRLRTKLRRGQKLTILNARKSRTVICRVVWTRPTFSDLNLVAFEFDEPTPSIWPAIGWPESWGLVRDAELGAG
jgi:hypothetical protein